MLNSFARGFVVEGILTEFIVMLPHDTNVLDALLLALALKRIVAVLERQTGNRVDHRAS